MTDTEAAVPLTKKCLVAVRPFAYTASVTPVILGLAVSYYAGNPVRWGLFLLTLLGVLCFHTAANLLNDCHDHKRGLDTEVLPTSGAIVRGWLTEAQVYYAALATLALGVACGVILVYATGPVLLLPGVLGMVIALGYTRAGLCFKYIGLGDLVIFVAFGILPVFGTYWVQAQQFSWLPIFWSVPLAALTVGILHANNWRDLTDDRSRNCRTFASMLGERGSRGYYRTLILGPFVMVGLCLLVGLVPGIKPPAPVTLLLVIPALPMAIRLSRASSTRNAAVFSMLDARTAQLQLLFGLLLPLAFVAARLLSVG